MTLHPPTTFTTRRLWLRPPEEGDAQAIFDGYTQDRAVTRYLSWAPHRSVRETQEFLAFCSRRWAEAVAFPWAILRQADQQLLGMVELRPQGHMAEVGYVLAQAYWRQGYMAEALRPVVEWALAQPTLYRVWAYHDVENPASGRVMEKVGMRLEGRLRRWMQIPAFAEPRDCDCYAIVR